jgi:hypothetical protein
MPYVKADVKNVFGKQTYCKCPKCEKLHKMLLDWKGRGFPRKFCPGCLHHLHYTMGGMDDDVGFSRYAAVSSVRSGKS